MNQPTETLAVTVSTSDAMRKLASLVTKLDKADIRAAESDKEAKALNVEVMGMCQGTVEQTIERSMATVVAEKSRAEKKAAGIRSRTGDDAVQVRDDFLEIQKEVIRLLAGYGIGLEVTESGEVAESDIDASDEEQDAEQDVE